MGITVYTTFSNQEEADEICDQLLAKKLIACANFFNVKSKYHWKDKIESSNEVAAFLTAKESNWQAIQDEIKKLHSYEVPCVKKYDFKTTPGYKNWIDNI